MEAKKPPWEIQLWGQAVGHERPENASDGRPAAMCADMRRLAVCDPPVHATFDLQRLRTESASGTSTDVKVVATKSPDEVGVLAET